MSGIRLQNVVFFYLFFFLLYLPELQSTIEIPNSQLKEFRTLELVLRCPTPQPLSPHTGTLSLTNTKVYIYHLLPQVEIIPVTKFPLHSHLKHKPCATNYDPNVFTRSCVHKKHYIVPNKIHVSEWPRSQTFYIN